MSSNFSTIFFSFTVYVCLPLGRYFRIALGIDCIDWTRLPLEGSVVGGLDEILHVISSCVELVSVCVLPSLLCVAMPFLESMAS